MSPNLGAVEASALGGLPELDDTDNPEWSMHDPDVKDLLGDPMSPDRQHNDGLREAGLADEENEQPDFISKTYTVDRLFSQIEKMEDGDDDVDGLLEEALNCSRSPTRNDAPDSAGTESGSTQAPKSATSPAASGTGATSVPRPSTGRDDKDQSQPVASVDDIAMAEEAAARQAGASKEVADELARQEAADAAAAAAAAAAKRRAEEEEEERKRQERLAAEERQRAEQEVARIEAEKRAEAARIETQRQAEAARIEAERQAEAARIQAERQAEAARIEEKRKEEAARIEAEKKAEAVAGRRGCARDRRARCGGVEDAK
jgi:hypothetical protein